MRIVLMPTRIKYDFPLEAVAIDDSGAIVPIADLAASNMSADPKQSLSSHCQHCKTRLHSEASITRGVCAGCFADRKQIGPDRPTG